MKILKKYILKINLVFIYFCASFIAIFTLAFFYLAKLMMIVYLSSFLLFKYNVYKYRHRRNYSQMSF